MWKIVGVSKALVIYIYIYIYRLSKCTTRANEAQSSYLLSKPYPSTINNKMKD